MTFTATEALVVKEALQDIHEAGLSADLYTQAHHAITRHEDGTCTVDCETTGGAKLLVRVCEILVASPAYA